MIHTANKNKRRLAAWIAAGGCGLWLLAQAVPADAQASRTRPGGGSSSGGSSSSSSGSGSSASGSSGGSSSGPVRVERTRPSGGSSGGPTVVDKRRPGRSGDFVVGRFHHHHFGWWGYPYYGGAWWLGWSWWYPSWGYPYYGYPYGHPPYGGRVYPHGGAALGALDTDVWPARTQVWIDGRYVGFVDQFDGFPRYLWLEQGTYDVVFYLEGFRTLARQYTVYPGLVIDVEDRLEPGESIHPTELAPKETPRAEARERAEPARAAAAEPEWERRVRADREAARGPEAVEAELDGARLLLAVRPSDAAVYLDGEFVGTAGELSDRAGGLAVEAGEHELSVVRPGYAPRAIEFEVEAGDELSLDIDLEESA